MNSYDIYVQTVNGLEKIQSIHYEGDNFYNARETAYDALQHLRRKNFKVKLVNRKVVETVMEDFS